MLIVIVSGVSEGVIYFKWLSLVLLVVPLSKMLPWTFFNSLHISDWTEALSENFAHFVWNAIIALFFWILVNFNSEVRETLNAGNLTLRLLKFAVK